MALKVTLQNSDGDELDSRIVYLEKGYTSWWPAKAAIEMIQTAGGLFSGDKITVAEVKT